MKSTISYGDPSVRIQTGTPDMENKSTPNPSVTCDTPVLPVPASQLARFRFAVRVIDKKALQELFYQARLAR